MAKKTVKKNVKKTNAFIKVKREETTETCCEKRWNLVPLRFALGLMFIAAGLPKLIGLISGGNQVPAFFTSLGIPFPVFSAWLVAIVEILGGALLMLGFMTCITGILLVIIMSVAALTTSIGSFSWINLLQHLVYIGALVAIMCGNKDFSLKPRVCRDCCKK